jgi:hypothetical protein
MTSKEVITGILVTLAVLGGYSIAKDDQSPDPQQLLEETVRTWQFKPATCDGCAIAMEMNVEVSFDRF